MVKKYYAYVAPDIAEHFEEKLISFGDRIKSVQRDELASNWNGTTFYPYIIEAEEGIIDPKWELPNRD